MHKVTARKTVLAQKMACSAGTVPPHSESKETNIRTLPLLFRLRAGRGGVWFIVCGTAV
jgi:hypothetical protein